MFAYLVLYQNNEFGVAIVGLYLNEKAAIRSAMRKVYQILDIKAIKIKQKWVWADTESVISVNKIKFTDIKDIKGESPLPQFLKYQEYLQDIPIEDLEKIKQKAINRKKLLDRLKSRN